MDNESNPAIFPDLQPEGYVISDANNTTGDIKNDVLMVPQTTQVKMVNDTKTIGISSRDIKRIISLCEQVKPSSHTFTEAALSIASLFAGASISAALSGVPFEPSFRGIFVYVVSPMIAVGMGVAFFLTRENEAKSTRELAKHIKEYLPQDIDVSDGGNTK